MIQDASYRRVGTPGLNKVGLVALAGVVATVGIIASFNQPQTQTQKVSVLPMIF